MPQILVGPIVAGLTPIVGAAVAEFAAPLLLGIAFSALGLLFAPKPPKPEEGRVPIQQDTPPIIYGYGETRIAGVVALHESTGSDIFYWVAAIAGHRIEEVTGYYLDDVGVVLSGNAVVGASGGAYGDERVRIYHRLGLATETSYSTELYFTELVAAGIWTAAHRGDSTASVAMSAAAPGSDNFQKRFPNGAPRLSVVAKMARVYDPRDGGQSPGSPATFQFSKNIALQILHLLCFNEYTADYDYTEAILPVVAEWTEAADICDENFALVAGGTEKRYHGGGWATTENDYKAVLAQMLAACDGWLCLRGDGTLTLTVGKFAVSGAVITDDMIVGFNIQDGPPDEEAINRLNVQYSSPDHGYSSVECDPFEEAAFDVSRPFVRSTTLDATWVQSFTHARRLGKREVYRQNQRKRGYFDLTFAGINCAYKRYIKIESTRFPTLDGTYIENRKPNFALMAGGIRIEWQSLGNGADIDIWTPAADEGAAPHVPDPPASIAAPVPANVNVAPQWYDGGTSEAVRLIISFDTPTLAEIYYRSRWRVKDTDPSTGGDQAGPWNTHNHTEAPLVSGSRSILYTGPVVAGTTLEVEIGTLGRKGTMSDWSPTEEVVTIADFKFSSGSTTFDGTGFTWDKN